MSGLSLRVRVGAGRSLWPRNVLLPKVTAIAWAQLWAWDPFPWSRFISVVKKVRQQDVRHGNHTHDIWSFPQPWMCTQEGCLLERGKDTCVHRPGESWCWEENTECASPVLKLPSICAYWGDLHSCSFCRVDQDHTGFEALDGYVRCHNTWWCMPRSGTQKCQCLGCLDILAELWVIEMITFHPYIYYENWEVKSNRWAGMGHHI